MPVSYGREALNPQPLPTPSKRKVAKRYDHQKKEWRQRQIDNCRCGVCGEPMPENDLRQECFSCRRRKIVRKTYIRHFMRDFR